MKNLLRLCLFLWPLTLFPQEIYVVNNVNDIKIVNADDLSVTDLFNIPITEAGYITDLAFSPDGRLFGVTNEWTLIEIDLVNETFAPLVNLPTGDAYTALVCNANNELFTSRYLSQELYSYNLDTQEVTFVDNDISTPGDYTFYKGNLVYPSFFNDFIKAYDGNEIVNIGCSVPLLWTFVNVFENCNNNTIYAFDQFAKMYRYDLETENFEEIADLVAETGPLYGGATRTEYMASQCPVETLETVVCDLSTADFNPYNIRLKNNPVDRFIRLDMSYPVRLNYTLVDAKGVAVKQGELKANQIATEGLSDGLYFLWMRDINGLKVFQKKILKH